MSNPDGNPEHIWRKYWDQWADAMKKRLDAGAQEYGEGSFSRPPLELNQELSEEALDICGWGFILWVRTQLLAAEIEKRQDEQVVTVRQNLSVYPVVDTSEAS